MLLRRYVFEFADRSLREMVLLKLRLLNGSGMTSPLLPALNVIVYCECCAISEFRVADAKRVFDAGGATFLCLQQLPSEEN